MLYRGPCPPGCCRSTGLGGVGRGGVGAVLGFTMGIGLLIGLNSLALGFKVDFLTCSGMPSGRSADSGLESSLPGVLAGCGVAGECRSETVPDVESLASAAGEGEG